MKKLISILLFAILLFCSVSTVNASNRWEWIIYHNQIEVFFDTQTIQLNPSNNIDVWLKYVRDYPDEDNISCYMAHLQFNPRSRMKKTLYLSGYRKDGKEISSKDVSSKTVWDQIVPGSNWERIMNACTDYLYGHREV